MTWVGGTLSRPSMGTGGCHRDDDNSMSRGKPGEAASTGGFIASPTRSLEHSH